MSNALPVGTHIGRVHLRVPDLAHSVPFYETHLGFFAHPIDSRSVSLTSREDGPEILRLTEHREARPRPSRTTGLFHVAIRLPSREALGQTLLHMLEKRTNVGGFADHGVSEAIYLADPDGNGLEFYADRPPENWPRTDHQIAMVSNPLDVESLLALAAPNRAAKYRIHPETRMGHVHLQVSNLARTEEFYAGELGFDVTQRSYPGALFFAAGGYHHHLGTNTWAGRGAHRPPDNAIGLISFSIVIPTAAENSTTKVVQDPDGHQIELMYV